MKDLGLKGTATQKWTRLLSHHTCLAYPISFLPLPSTIAFNWQEVEAHPLIGIELLDVSLNKSASGFSFSNLQVCSYWALTESSMSNGFLPAELMFKIAWPHFSKETLYHLKFKPKFKKNHKAVFILWLSPYPSWSRKLTSVRFWGLVFGELCSLVVSHYAAVLCNVYFLNSNY